MVCVQNWAKRGILLTELGDWGGGGDILHNTQSDERYQALKLNLLLSVLSGAVMDFVSHEKLDKMSGLFPSSIGTTEPLLCPMMTGKTEAGEVGKELVKQDHGWLSLKSGQTRVCTKLEQSTA